MNNYRYLNKSKGFEFVDLDSENIREHMVSEIKLDISKGRLNFSKRFNQVGKIEYPDLLIETTRYSNEEELAKAIKYFFNSTEMRNGKVNKVPKSAAKIFAEGEFNRFYIRAVCLEAISNGDENVEIYRGRASKEERPQSNSKIGQTVNAKKLLEDLRINIGASPLILPEVNSGLTVKLLGSKNPQRIGQYYDDRHIDSRNEDYHNSGSRNGNDRYKDSRYGNGRYKDSRY